MGKKLKRCGRRLARSARRLVQCCPGPDDSCCIGINDDWASRAQGFRPAGVVGPCAVTPINPQRPALLDWCAGSAAQPSSVRMTISGSGTVTGRYSRPNSPPLLARTLDLSWTAAPTQVTGALGVGGNLPGIVCAGSGGGEYTETLDNGGGPFVLRDTFSIQAPRLYARMLMLTGGVRTHGFSGEYQVCDGTTVNNSGFQAGWNPGPGEIVFRNTSGVTWPPGAFSPWDLQQINSGSAVTLPGGSRWRVVRSYSVERQASGNVVASVTATMTMVARGDLAWDSLVSTCTINATITPLSPCQPPNPTGQGPGDVGTGTMVMTNLIRQIRGR